MFFANEGIGKTDSDVLDYAIENRGEDGIVVIGKRTSEIEPERDYWLIDRAITLPADTTVVLRSCMIKLSDQCRDNFFRTANCGIGIEDPETIRNVHIRGEGLCVLQGADHPRSTGDGNKEIADPCPHEKEEICKYAKWLPPERRSVDTLIKKDWHDHSFGTDAGKEGESQRGDWRNIGILFANAEEFSISGVKIVDSHAWAISLEACSYGRVERIEFFAENSKMIDGMRQSIKNQDGLDLRNGCHHIVISDITGQTGDDVVALTAIAGKEPRPGGGLCTSHVMHTDYSRRESGIHDIVIRNVCARANVYSTLRMLPVETKIYNIVADGIVNTSTEEQEPVGCAMILGTADSTYGRNLPDGLRFITISNVICNSATAITVKGLLRDSVITNVINKNPNCPVLSVARENGMVNVLTSNLCTVQP